MDTTKINTPNIAYIKVLKILSINIFLLENNSIIKIENSIVQNNQQTSNGQSGGGVALRDGSSAHIEDVIIQNNSTQNWGGGLYLYTNCSARVINSSINNNSALNGNGGGIAVDDESSLKLINVFSFLKPNVPCYGNSIFVCVIRVY